MYTTTKTLPEFSSIGENSISIISHDENIPVRLLDTKGVKIRLYINMTENNVHINCLEAFDAKLLDPYKNMLKGLIDNFFYGDAYVYAVYNKKLFIYDIYTNSNYLSSRDMEKIKNEYGYGDVGFNTLEPLASGIIPTKHLLEIAAASNNPKSLRLLPAVYLVRDEISQESKSQKDVLILGEEPKSTYNYGRYYKNGKYYYDDYDYDDGYGYGYGTDYYKTHIYDSATGKYVLREDFFKETANKTVKEEKNDDKKEAVPEFSISKEMRKKNMDIVYERVSKYIEKKPIFPEVKPEYMKYVKELSYLISLSEPASVQKYVYDFYESVYLKQNKNFIKLNGVYNVYYEWADMFASYWTTNFSKELKRCGLDKDMTVDMVFAVLYEELKSMYTDYFTKGQYRTPEVK